MLPKLSVIHFSPAGGTRKAALLLAENLAKEIVEIDLSLPETTSYLFTEADTVIIAAPVYGGRIPAYMADKLKACTGSGAKAITAAVYGGRAYEDALLELNDCAQTQGFQLVASAVLLAEHSIVHAIATGRPDLEDAQWIHTCAQQILTKLETMPKQSAPDAPITSFTVPGNRPYKEWTNLPAVPLTTDTCTNCRTCITQCPTQAISPDAPQITDPQTCILCMRCVTICPTHSKLLPPPMLSMLTQKLAPFQSLRQPNELYL